MANTATLVAGPTRNASVCGGDVVAGKFLIDRVVGQGGIAVVFRATHTALDEPVALKFLRADVATDELRARFAQEARAAVKLKSEYVCRVSDVGAHDDAPFMVMEYLEGKTLEQLASAGPVAVDLATEIVIQACAGLAEAHARGIVHRDVKPENFFLVERDGWRQVKLLDFGISKVALEGRVSNVDLKSNETTAAVGSPYYMSPEQIRSARSVDHRTDVWSLGAVLFELLTGTTAFSETNEFASLIAEILERPHRDLKAMRPDVPDELVAIVNRCMEKDREKRFQNCGQLAVALLPFSTKRARVPAEQAVSYARSSGLDSVTRVPSTRPPPAMDRVSHVSVPLAPVVPSFSTAPSIPSEALGPASVSTPAPVPERKRKGGWMVAVVLLALLLAGVLGGVLVLRRPPAGPTTAEATPTVPAPPTATATQAAGTQAIPVATAPPIVPSATTDPAPTQIPATTARPAGRPTPKPSARPTSTPSAAPTQSGSDLEIRRNR